MTKHDLHQNLKFALFCIRKACFISLTVLSVLFVIGLLINPDLTCAVAFIVLILSLPSLITLGAGIFLIWIFYRITGDWNG